MCLPTKQNNSTGKDSNLLTYSLDEASLSLFLLEYALFHYVQRRLQ
jgi:hypothetical protein